jgi:hypothetical protein
MNWPLIFVAAMLGILLGWLLLVLRIARALEEVFRCPQK